MRWESGKPAFGFPLFHPLRRRPVGNVGIAQRFPRTVGSGVCFPSVRHFHRQGFLFGRCFRFRFLGLLDAVARDVQLEDDAVVHEAVNRSRGSHRVFEDTFPLRERQVARDQNAATFVPFSQQSEQYLHLLTALLYVAEIIDDQSFERRQALDEAAQLQIAFGDQQVLHEQSRSGEVNAAPSRDQLLADGAKQVRFSAPRIAERQNVFTAIQELAFE